MGEFWVGGDVYCGLFSARGAMQEIIMESTFSFN